MKLKALAVAAVLAAAGGLLASCETMSAEECAGADWGQLGYNDASRSGRDSFGDRAQSCADKGFTADQGAYLNGFGSGMRVFCTPEGGFQFARNGGTFSGQCPSDLAEDFSYGYADGRRVHDAQAEIDSIRGAISSAESRRNQNEEDMNDRQRALRDAQTDQERADWRAAIDQLRRERRAIDDDLRNANDRLPRALRLMDQIRYDIGGRYGPW
jgi:hypothetical protein